MAQRLPDSDFDFSDDSQPKRTKLPDSAFNFEEEKPGILKGIGNSLKAMALAQINPYAQMTANEGNKGVEMFNQSARLAGVPEVDATPANAASQLAAASSEAQKNNPLSYLFGEFGPLLYGAGKPAAQLLTGIGRRAFQSAATTPEAAKDIAHVMYQDSIHVPTQAGATIKPDFIDNQLKNTLAQYKASSAPNMRRRAEFLEKFMNDNPLPKNMTPREAQEWTQSFREEAEAMRNKIAASGRPDKEFASEFDNLARSMTHNMGRDLTKQGFADAARNYVAADRYYATNVVPLQKFPVDKTRLIAEGLGTVAAHSFPGLPTLGPLGALIGAAALPRSALGNIGRRFASEFNGGPATALNGSLTRRNLRNALLGLFATGNSVAGTLQNQP